MRAMEEWVMIRRLKMTALEVTINMYEALNLVKDEVHKAYEKWPVGSTNPLQHLAIILEELGEAARPINDEWNSGKDRDETIKEFREEMVQVAAMAIRALMEVW